MPRVVQSKRITLVANLKRLQVRELREKERRIKSQYKINTKTRAVGDRYPPGPLEGEKASCEATGQLPRKAIPSWAGLELLAEWADLRRQRIQAQTIRRLVRYPQKPPDFPAHGVLEYRDRLGISRQDCREISSVGSLLFRRHMIIMYVWSAPRSCI